MLAEKLSAKGQPNRLFDFVLNNYFRISPSGPIHKYISAVQEQSPIRRLHFAQIYNYPEVIEALAYDIDPWVREAARNNKYWQYLGQFKQLLRMNKHDKICFIQKEHFSTLLIFIVFETDLEVLESLFQNPTISIQMLLTLRNYLKKRGKGARDTKMLKLIERTIAIKRNRVVKISEIVQQFNHSESIHPLTNILKFLLDEDPLIVQSAINALYQFEHQEVMNFLFEPNPLALDHQSNYRLLWHILDRLKIHYRVPKKDLPELSETDKFSVTEQKIFMNQLSKRKLLILETCAEDLSDEDYFLTILTAHLDPDPKIHEKANQVLYLDDILALISDDSFPKSLSARALKILKAHPSPTFQKKLSETFVELSEKNRKFLKDLETSIHAYFDIVSSYINDFRAMTPPIVDRKKRELVYFFEIIKLIQNLPAQFLKKQGYSIEENAASFEDVSQKIKLLWRATTGQYLGRIKKLDEVIGKKWIEILPDEMSSRDFLQERNEAIRALERNYKAEVQCHLNIACETCMKRTCAAERFLRQIDFFFGELIEFLESDETAENENAG